MSKRKVKNNIDGFDDILKNLDNKTPVEKSKMRENQLRKRNFKYEVEDPYLLKKRAYELIIQGFSSKSYVPILVEEFGITPAVVTRDIKGLAQEVREQYEEIYSVLRESIVMDLINMKNNAKTIHEKIKCIEMIVKITGLSQEIVINHSQDSRTFIISPTSDNKKELE